ncbi:MAG: hypothetical protein VX589_14220 [Myxococcota bacterium]|nr:hypothetical protein [Myxococcota bacterium]
MIRNRHYIPLGFAVLTLGLAIFISSMGERIFRESKTCNGDYITEYGPIQLEAGKNYDLGVFMPNLRRPANGFAGTMFVSLEDADGELLFEIEDSYWAESGTWYEDGESGTWYENNVKTVQYFHAERAGKYTVKVHVRLSQPNAPQASNLSLGPSPSTAVVVYVDRRYASAVVFGVTSFILFVLSVLSMSTRGYAYRKFLASARLGDRLKYDGEWYRVDDVWDFASYKRGPVAKNVLNEFDCELRLLSEAGAVRYLSVETHDCENDEGDDVDYDIVAWSLPIDSTAVTYSGPKDRPPNRLNYRGATYYIDRDKSGYWYGRSRYRDDVNGQANDTVYIETEPYAKYKFGPASIFVTRSEDDGDVEWYASTVIKWKRAILKSDSIEQPESKDT